LRGLEEVKGRRVCGRARLKRNWYERRELIGEYVGEVIGS